MKNRHSVLSVLIAFALLPFGWSSAMLPGSGIAIAQSISPADEKPKGWYGSVSPGVVFGYDLNVTSAPFTVEVPPVLGTPVPPVEVAPVDISVDTDTGYNISGAVGYQFENARVELEVSYNQSSVNNVSVDGAAPLPAEGSVSALAVSANGYYDIPTNSKWRPYIGGGVGLANFSANDVQANIPILGEMLLDDNGAGLVFQAQAGVAYDFSERASGFVGYRFQGVPGPQFTVQDIAFDADTVFINTVQAGARVRF